MSVEDIDILKLFASDSESSQDENKNDSDKNDDPKNGEKHAISATSGSK